MTDTINGRTPEEIKKGMECCCTEDLHCSGCNYCNICDIDVHAIDRDALAYIQQLERERDAAVENIFPWCGNCKHEKLGYGVGPCPPIEEYLTNDCGNWEWCGVQEVE